MSRPLRFNVLVITAALLAAYANSFSGSFVLDEVPHLLGDPIYRDPRLWLQALTRSTRPLIAVSFALNHVLSGWDLRLYHAVNLALHLFTALALFGILRRSFLTERLRSALAEAQPLPAAGFRPPRSRARTAGSATPLALVIALLWALHPLQTSSVTYLIQRAEVAMGLFYLLTLYCVIRSTLAEAQPLPAAGSRPPRSRSADLGSARRWKLLALLSCLLGMLSKPVMATAPILALWYDRLFLARSWKELRRDRGPLYAGLFACWLPLGLLLFNSAQEYQLSAGFGLAQVTPLAYALTQPAVILHYLKLSLWPCPLTLDYAWPLATGIQEPFIPLTTLGLLVGLLLWRFRRHPEVAFLTGWFFLILSPTSSFIPLADAAFEHRMYLPLVAVVCGVVLAAHRLLRRGRAAAAVAAMLALATMTFLRNGDFRSYPHMWRTTLERRPQNARAWGNLGFALYLNGMEEEAISLFLQGLRIRPDLPELNANLACALAGLQDPRRADLELRQALRLDDLELPLPPSLRPVHPHPSVASPQALQEAERLYRTAISLRPGDEDFHAGLGGALFKLGRSAEAEQAYRRAIQLDSRSAETHNTLGLTLHAQGRPTEALPHYLRAVELKPGLADACNNVGTVLAQQGSVEEAARWFFRALQAEPAGPVAWNSLGVLRANQGNLRAALFYFSTAVKLDPEYRQARDNLREAQRQREAAARAVEKKSPAP